MSENEEVTEIEKVQLALGLAIHMSGGEIRVPRQVIVSNWSEGMRNQIHYDLQEDELVFSLVKS